MALAADMAGVSSERVFSSKRVLLIEDNALDAELACVSLRRAGLDVDVQVAACEEEVSAALANTQFDVILSDFQLPGFSGSAALRMVRNRDAHIPFIVVSGMLGEENAVEMLRQGATDYVLKQRLDRLPFAVSRALTEASERTQRARAEHRLRERENYFAQVIDNLKDYSVATLDREGRIESWNAASETIFGFAASDVVGTSCARFFPEDNCSAQFKHNEFSSQQQLQRELECAASAGSHVDERWLLRKDAARFHASIVTTAIRDGSGELRGFSRIVRDTTDSRIAADLLQTAKEQAEAANAAKDRFLAVLSHELRNPLSPIVAAAHLLDLQKNLTAEARASVAMIKRNVELEARLIDDLLDISRIVNDKLTLDFADVELVELVRATADAFRSEAHDRAIDLRFETSIARAPVRGDSARLQQIVWNLLKNALKFTGSGGRVRIVIDAVDDDRYRVTVSDTGIGISSDALERIFCAFEQGDNNPATGRGGLGLGLAIANSLAQKHGGTLTVQSDGAGRGATFVFMLERLQKTAKPNPGAKDHRAALTAEQWLRILLVEDNTDTCTALRDLLHQLGHRVDVAANVSEASRQLQRENYHVLLSDMGLPDGDGLDVLREFQRCGGRYAIALTGYGMHSDIQRCLTAGFSEHMTKPVNVEKLRALLRNHQWQ